MDVGNEVAEWDDDAFELALDQAKDGEIQAPNIYLGAEQLGRLLAVAPRRPDHPTHAELRSVDFRGTTFSGDADFGGVRFSGDAEFGGVSFSGHANFQGVSFSAHADFTRASFSGDVRFGGASFSGGYAGFEGVSFRGYTGFERVSFSEYTAFGGASFSGKAYFGDVSFSGDAYFDGASFSGGYADFHGANFRGNAAFHGASFNTRADFHEVIFNGRAYFDGASFNRRADFRRASFKKDADFDEASFNANADFRGANFEAAGVLGPILVCDRLSLDGVVFAQPVRIVASARRASFTRTEFRRGADLRLRWAELWIEDTDFAEESLLTSFSGRVAPGERERPFLGFEFPTDDGQWLCALSREPPANAEPRVLTLAASRVASLTLSGVNLEDCRFATTHGLDHLGLERVTFLDSAHGWRWTRRQTIAEEHYWRAARANAKGWNPRREPYAGWPPQSAVELSPYELASLYRQLRKGREDTKDEPGANDFYYGEMEMRRRSGRRAERLILWAYWLVAGYGLRASRALLALAVTILLGAIPLALWGFHPARSYGRSLLFAMQSSISLLRAASPPAHETAGAQVVEIILRLAGPLFFGLALIALRGRVKR